MKITGFLCICILGIMLVRLADVGIRLPINDISYGLLSHREVSKEPQVKPSTQTVSLASYSKNYSTMILVGDVLLARNVEVLMERYADSYPYQGIDFKDLSFSPLVVGNFESSVPVTHKPTKSLGLNFSTHEKYLKSAASAGFTHFSLANNHSLDAGESDYKNTNVKLYENNLTSFGHPIMFNQHSVSVVEVEGRRIALIALHAIETEVSDELLSRVFQYANNISQQQIVYVHWGIEYDSVHSLKQETLAIKLVQAGADLVVGHHPHVVQDIGLIDGVPIFYSLGNYIFDQYFSTAVQEGLMLQINFVAKPYIDLIPVTSVGTLSQPNYMTDLQHVNFLRDLAKKSNSLLRKDIESGMIPLRFEVATSSKLAMIKQ